MKHANNLTSKGQVTVPKTIRDALGLVPGQPVRFSLDADGTARILKADTDAELACKKADFLARLERAQRIFRANDAFPQLSTDEFMAMVREPRQPFERDRGED